LGDWREMISLTSSNGLDWVFGEFDSLPDFVTVVALPGKFGRFFSFSVAIMSRLRDVGWASL
jgi:hypothetical protein